MFTHASGKVCGNVIGTSNGVWGRRFSNVLYTCGSFWVGGSGSVLVILFIFRGFFVSLYPNTQVRIYGSVAVFFGLRVVVRVRGFSVLAMFIVVSMGIFPMVQSILGFQFRNQGIPRKTSKLYNSHKEKLSVS